MNKIEKNIDSLIWKARAKSISFQQKAVKAFKNEDGDTNFLSIIIILAIVLLLAIVFIAFKDKIVALINNTFAKFKGSFEGQTENNFENIGG